MLLLLPPPPDDDDALVVVMKPPPTLARSNAYTINPKQNNISNGNGDDISYMNNMNSGGRSNIAMGTLLLLLLDAIDDDVDDDTVLADESCVRSAVAVPVKYGF